MPVTLWITGLALAAQEAPPPSLAWLTGTWCTAPHPAARGVTCERWEPAAGGGMRGTGENRRDGKVKPGERMEIRQDRGGYVFHAEPPGQPPADFRAEADDVAELTVTFTNPRHDYPQRIRYWRDGDMLMAEAALADGSKAISWKYLPAK